MTTALWKLNVICEKHNITISELLEIFHSIDSGAFMWYYNRNINSIKPKLQEFIDDLVDAGFVGKVILND